MQYLNLGVLAHVDAGKTTTVERMLYLGGATRAVGSVDAGSTQSDFLAVERERGISVASSCVRIEHKGITINLIDTPGHMDFTGEVERALYALDAVVLVVSAAEGVQSQTELFLREIRRQGLPALLFVNKIDRVGCRPDEVEQELRAIAGAPVVALTRAVRPGESDCGVEPAEPGEDDLLALCELDEALADRVLGGEDISGAELRESLAVQSRKGKALPLLHGAAAMGLGIERLMDAVVAYLPCATPQPDAPASGVVYKIEHDAQAGKTAYVRLHTGALAIRDAVEIHRPGQEPFSQKVTQIRRVLGARKEESGRLESGDIGAVYGLTGARVGDWLGKAPEKALPRIAQPLFLVQVQAPATEPNRLMAAVAELSDEDPLLDYDWDAQTRELVIRIMGPVQLEILAYLLKERYGIAATFSPPSVIYKETPRQLGIGYERYTMPKPCWAVVELAIEPLPRGSGYVFESRVHRTRLLERYQHHVETSVPETLRQGLFGWEVTDLKVTLTDGEHHQFHTHPMDFFLATPIAVMRGLTDCGMQLLEPVTRLRLSCDEALSGRIIGDIVGMRGSFDSPVMKNGTVAIEALVPVAESMDYAIRFASLTSGKGRLSADFHGYQDCPEDKGQTLPRKGVNPLDRAKWILHKRGALN